MTLRQTGGQAGPSGNRPHPDRRSPRNPLPATPCTHGRRTVHGDAQEVPFPNRIADLMEDATVVIIQLEGGAPRRVPDKTWLSPIERTPPAFMTATDTTGCQKRRDVASAGSSGPNDYELGFNQERTLDQPPDPERRGFPSPMEHRKTLPFRFLRSAQRHEQTRTGNALGGRSD